ncbi:transmembrane protein 26-like [Liolophura sinensis]|uniref:transmembrane protein 26-like n=1 Tax=Liolophura sinensis TaxID=3198878 RepID=UPI003158FB41
MAKKTQLFAIFQAFLARLLFFVHSFVAIWRCTDVLGNSKLWLLTLSHVALIIETLITCCFLIILLSSLLRFSPAIFIFLSASVPPIWFLELDRLDKYATSVGHNNITAVTESLSNIQGITIPLKLSPSLWVTVIEQILLLFLILGRWIMPKGEISRDALSQLLFVYIGMSSDIMELFVLFEEEQVLQDTYLSYAILTVWTVSLLQFCMVLTATKNPKKTRVTLSNTNENTRAAECRPTACCGKFCTTEVWSIFVSLFFQDGPFLVVRMYVMVKYYLITYNTIFFTCKNMLVVVLLLYRVFVVCTRVPGEEESEKETVHQVTVQNMQRNQKLNSIGLSARTPSPETVAPSGEKLGLVFQSQTSGMLGYHTPKFSVPL